MLIAYVLSAIFFYLSHCLLHFKFFYDLIHTHHHKFTNPFATVSMNGHVLEYIFSIILTIFIPPLIVGMDRVGSMAFFWIGTVDIFVIHTSYSFDNWFLNSMFGNSRFHYLHHRRYKYNYGLDNLFTPFMDRLFGTYTDILPSNEE